MMNSVSLMGRITEDLVLKQTTNGKASLTFNIAVERNFARQGEERQSDFIRISAWGSQAEFISKYFAKGRMIGIEGTLRSRTYDDQNGVRHYVTEVLCNQVSFTGEPKMNPNGNQPQAQPSPQQTYVNQPAQNQNVQNQPMQGQSIQGQPMQNQPSHANQSQMQPQPQGFENLNDFDFSAF